MQGTEHYILLLEWKGRNITYYYWSEGDGKKGILFVMYMKVNFNFGQWHSLTAGTDKLMDGCKFRSGLTEVTGDGIYKCITMNQISFDPLTDIWTYRAAYFAAKNLNHLKKA